MNASIMVSSHRRADRGAGPIRTLEIFADIRCPFTHLSMRRLVEWRIESGVEFVMRVRAWPLELVNGEPLSAELVAEEADALKSGLAPDLFGRHKEDHFPRSSIPAMCLAAAAYDHGLDAGERANLLLRDAMFEQGADVADPSVVDRIAAELDVSRPLDRVPDVIGDWHEGRRRGVIGSPHFFVGSADFFCPSLRIERVDGHLRVDPDPRGFDELVHLLTGD